MNESLKDLKPELESLSGKLELEVSNFLNHLSFTSDPIAAITGEKGRWLILNPFVKTKPLLDNEPFIFWSLFSNKVRIPSWDGVYERKSERSKLIDLLKEKEKLLDETSIVLNSPDALLNNGYFNLYLKRFFRRKRFESQAIDLINDLSIEVEVTKKELDTI